MITKDDLLRCKELKGEVERAEMRLAEMQPSVTSNMQAMPRGSVSTSSVERLAVNRLELEQLLRGIVEERRLLISGILISVAALPSIEREVIILRYIDVYSWQQISDIVHYSKQRLYEIHSSALLHIQSISESRL